jgi:quercetin dioxygenase-like cupin family protein
MTDMTRTAPAPFATAPDGGEDLWFLGSLFTVRASGEQTGGAYALCECVLRQGPAAPLHVQPGDDETFHVLEGEATFHVDGRELHAPAGSTVFVPRGTPHAFRIDSPQARLLVLNTPAGHERFFRAMAEPAPRRELPPVPTGPPDMAAMAAAAHDAGFEILGPPPF